MKWKTCVALPQTPRAQLAMGFRAKTVSSVVRAELEGNPKLENHHDRLLPETGG
jgi:hypothetical protein